MALPPLGTVACNGGSHVLVLTRFICFLSDSQWTGESRISNEKEEVTVMTRGLTARR